MKIAIDGPGGAGKSTISRTVAKELGFIYIDTGAMYRAVALYAIRKGVDTASNAVINLLPKIDISISYIEGEQHIFLCGEDVSSQIRTPEVSVGASNVAVIPEVRLKLVELQRQLAQSADVIMDGRDIGTYVLPDAEVKIFLTASPKARAERRFKELCEKGQTCTYEEVLKDLTFRDANDSGRAFAPLMQAEDAIRVDTTEYTFSESVEKVISIIKGKM